MIRVVFFALFFIQFVHAQTIENVEKLQFVYSNGHSSWENNGIYSISEVVELSKVPIGDYRISRFLKINSIRKNKSVFVRDTISYQTDKYSLIQKFEIENLLVEINTNRENFTEDFLRANFIKPTRKEIFELAKKTDNKDYFKNGYDDKRDVERKYVEIQNYKYLNEYLLTNKPIVDEGEVVTDAWNRLQIITISQESTKVYDMQFFRNDGQPICSYAVEPEGSEKIKLAKKLEKRLINLEVNKLLQNILPPKTMIWRSLDLNNIRDNYIEWFLGNKHD